MKIQGQRLFRHRPILGEAMQHSANFSRALFAQNAQGVLAGVAGMHNQGLAQRAGGGDMNAKSVLLAADAVPTVIVIQPGFTNRDHPWLGAS